MEKSRFEIKPNKNGGKDVVTLYKKDIKFKMSYFKNKHPNEKNVY